jgi:hypothetical protein
MQCHGLMSMILNKNLLLAQILRKMDMRDFPYSEKKYNRLHDIGFNLLDLESRIFHVSKETWKRQQADLIDLFT